MCFGTRKPKKPDTPAPPPPPPSEEKAPTPQIGDVNDELSLRRDRKGRSALVVGLKKPTGGSGLSLKGLV